MKKVEVTRKEQQSCREQPETPSSALEMPRGELIWDDNKDKPRVRQFPAEMLLWRKRGYMAKQRVKM